MPLPSCVQRGRPVSCHIPRVSHSPVSENFNQLAPPRAEGVTYRCRGRGALLSLPRGGIRQDVINQRMFIECIRDNVDSWLNWSRAKGLPVERMDDLILVTGCTLVNSWAAAAFDDYAADGAQVSLTSRTLKNGGAGFVWGNIRGAVVNHDSQLNPVCSILVTFTRCALTFFVLLY